MSVIFAVLRWLGVRLRVSSKNLKNIGKGDLISDHMGWEEVLWSARRVSLLGRPTAGTLQCDKRD